MINFTYFTSQINLTVMKILYIPKCSSSVLRSLHDHDRACRNYLKEKLSILGPVYSLLHTLQ